MAAVWKKGKFTENVTKKVSQPPKSSSYISEPWILDGGDISILAISNIKWGATILAISNIGWGVTC